jgi:pSer/pThr/pTyr-binding forkhead associated (FHA) protein
MQVKLKVLLGAAAGREIKVAGNRFLIGRGEECQLRPRSEAISRQHCAIVIDDAKVEVRDLQSRNGTLVNEAPVEGAQELHPGDQLRIGPLSFEVVIDYPVGGAKRPVARDVKEVARRTATTNPEDLDIAEWLENGETDDSSTDVSSPETRQFQLDDTHSVAMETDTDVAAEQQTVVTETAESEDESEAESADGGKNGKSGKKKAKKDGPAKLPPMPKFTAADSREAAADMLKRFFNRR